MNHWYYYDLQGNKKGPVDWDTLRQLAKNRKIFPNTQIVMPDGKTTTALKVEGLDFSAASAPPNTKTGTSVNEILESFRTTNYKKEILPINAHNAVVLLKDPTFWIIFVLGALPVAIASLLRLHRRTQKLARRSTKSSNPSALPIIRRKYCRSMRTMRSFF